MVAMARLRHGRVGRPRPLGSRRHRAVCVQWLLPAAALALAAVRHASPGHGLAWILAGVVPSSNIGRPAKAWSLGYSADEMQAMKVNALKKALSERGLSVTGKKDLLIARLSAAENKSGADEEPLDYDEPPMDHDGEDDVVEAGDMDVAAVFQTLEDTVEPMEEAGMEAPLGLGKAPEHHEADAKERLVQEHFKDIGGSNPYDAPYGSTTDHQVLEFGKHAGLTYEEVIESDPDYCTWALQVAKHSPEGIRAGLQKFVDAILASKPDLDWQIVLFGKHRNKAFKVVAQEDPEYCAWVMSVASNTQALESSSASLLAFASYLGKNRPELAELPMAVAADTLTFGKYKGLLYKDVVQQDPDYCKWVAVQATQPDVSTSLKAFAEYVRENAGDLLLE